GAGLARERALRRKKLPRYLGAAFSSPGKGASFSNETASLVATRLLLNFRQSGQIVRWRPVIARASGGSGCPSRRSEKCARAASQNLFATLERLPQPVTATMQQNP